MRGRDLRHVIRATARIAQDQGEPDPILVVIGSQAIHASYRDSVIPTAMTMSAEADLIVVTANATDLDRFATLVDGAIGEASPFHETHGYYGQGVGPETATLPEGWVDRLVPIRDRASDTVAFCLEPHDLCAAKLCAGRPKDLEYVRAALEHRLVDGATINERLGTITQPAARRAATVLVRLDTNPMMDAERNVWQRNRSQAMRDRLAEASGDRTVATNLNARLRAAASRPGDDKFRNSLDRPTGRVRGAGHGIDL